MRPETTPSTPSLVSMESAPHSAVEDSQMTLYESYVEPTTTVKPLGSDADAEVDHTYTWHNLGASQLNACLDGQCC